MSSIIFLKKERGRDGKDRGLREDGMSDSDAEGTPALPAALGAAEPSVGPPREAAPVCRETSVFIALGTKFTACRNLNLQ